MRLSAAQILQSLVHGIELSFGPGVGRPGAFEVLLRYSYADFDSKSIRGGKFTRITPMLNWYLNEVMRLEFTYGYSVLNRFDLQGRTQYFQTRLQMANDMIFHAPTYFLFHHDLYGIRKKFLLERDINDFRLPFPFPFLA